MSQQALCEAQAIITMIESVENCTLGPTVIGMIHEDVSKAIRAAVEAATKDLEETNARLTVNRYACDVDAPGDVCLTHQRKIDAAVEAEREACANDGVV